MSISQTFNVSAEDRVPPCPVATSFVGQTHLARPSMARPKMWCDFLVNPSSKQGDPRKHLIWDVFADTSKSYNIQDNQGLDFHTKFYYWHSLYISDNFIIEFELRSFWKKLPKIVCPVSIFTENK